VEGMAVIELVSDRFLVDYLPKRCLNNERL